MYWLAQDSYHQSLIRFYLDRAATAEGIIMISIGLMLAALLIGFDRLKWFALGLTLYISAYSYSRAIAIAPLIPLPPPFRSIAALCQPLTFSCLLLLAIVSVKPMAWSRTRHIHLAALFLWAVQEVIAFRQLSGGYTERGLSSIAGCTVVLIILGFGLPRWLYDQIQIRSMARAVSWFALMLCLSTVAVLIIDRPTAFVSNRLTGITDNPQRTATALALTVPFSLMLATDPGNHSRSRMFHLILSLISAGFLVFTASRTGALALIIGIMIFFRKKLGAIVMAGLMLFGVFLAALSFQERDLAYARNAMLRTDDTRSEVWLKAMDHFWSSPVFGVSMDIAAVENSYITVAAMSGIVGLIPLTLMLWMLFRSLRSMSRALDPGPYQAAINLSMASIAQFCVIWMFEGYIVALVTNGIILFYCTLAIMTTVNERLSEVDHRSTLLDAGAIDDGTYGGLPHHPAAAG